MGNFFDSYKKIIAFVTAIFTLLVMPLITFTWSFIVTTTSTNAEMPSLKLRVDKITNDYARIQGRLDTLLESQYRIEDREYLELKRAYEKRHANKQ